MLARVHNKEESVQLPYTLSKMSPLSTVVVSKNVLNVVINTLVLLADIIVGARLYIIGARFIVGAHRCATRV